MIDKTRLYTQDEIFAKEIQLEAWAIRVEKAERAYMNAKSSNYVQKAIERGNIRDVYHHLKRELKAMRERVMP